jgi:hypothetical protein
MSNEPEKDPIFVMNSLSEQSQAGHYFSSESLEDQKLASEILRWTEMVDF